MYKYEATQPQGHPILDRAPVCLGDRNHNAGRDGQYGDSRLPTQTNSAAATKRHDDLHWSLRGPDRKT